MPAPITQAGDDPGHLGYVRLTKLEAEAREVDDRIAWPMRCARALENSYHRGARRCFPVYPALRGFVGHGSHSAFAREVLLALKDHAVELGRMTISDELRCIHVDDGTVDDVVQKTRRSKVQVRLKKNFTPAAVLPQPPCSAATV